MKRVLILLVALYTPFIHAQNIDTISSRDTISMLEDVVILSSRVEQKIMESSITIEKIDATKLALSSGVDQYDGLAKLSGVHINKGSLTFTSINTRGFATISNARFQQLIDGVDNAAPFLNFGIGNMIGVSDLDMQSVELVPGASSGLYGPNAFNGLLYIKTKDPYIHQGLSVLTKAGITQSEPLGIHPIVKIELRVAEAFPKGWAIKANVSYMQGTDWLGANYSTDRITQNETPNNPDFDGLNLYGDEGIISMNPVVAKNSIINNIYTQFLPYYGNDETATKNALSLYIDSLQPFAVKRTGFKEEDLLNTDKAKSIKADAGLYKKFGQDMSYLASYNYRIGYGNTVFHSGERYAFRNVSQQFHRLELKNDFFNVMSYMTKTDFGNSNNLTALAALSNEKFKPTAQWAPQYLSNYTAQIIQTAIQNHNGIIGNITSDDISLANAVARDFANLGIPEVGSIAFDTTIQSIRDKYFQRGGAKLKDNSAKYFVEGNINFGKWTGKIIDVQLGMNYTQYKLNTEGTVYNEDPDGDGIAVPIQMREFGTYIQLIRKFWDDRCIISGSLRWDKNQNFNGNITPRLSGQVALGEDKNHHIRIAAQTGFRNPETIAQYIYFPASAGIILGGTKYNAERYGLYEGGAIKKYDWDKFLATKDSAYLRPYNMNYSSPERLFSLDLGYKTLLFTKLFIDVNTYLNFYNNYQAQILVVSIDSTRHKGNFLPGVNSVLEGQAARPTTWNAYTNIDGVIKSWGVSMNITYFFHKFLELNANYSYIDYIAPQDIPAKDVAFNTPQHRFYIGVNGKNIGKVFSYDIGYKWQESFLWSSSFGTGQVGDFGTLDIGMGVTIAKSNIQIRASVNNAVGKGYVTNYGGPTVGRVFLMSLLLDLKKMD